MSNAVPHPPKPPSGLWLSTGHRGCGAFARVIPDLFDEALVMFRTGLDYDVDEQIEKLFDVRSL